jgi:DNA repair protein RecN (Recombination protein N)
MLLRLHVKNFLLIADAELEFSPHLNVLTGETGTGKSLLLGALGLALGSRAASSWIGPEGDRVMVEAAFRADRPLLRSLSGMGIVTEGREVLLSRQVRAGGGSRCFVNGQQVLQRSLQRLGAQLVEIHGQRQEERFRHPDVQRDLLDLFGEAGERRRRVRLLFAAAQEAARQLEEHDGRLASIARDEEYLRFQLQEIEQLHPRAGELGEIKEQVLSLKTIAQRQEWIRRAERTLNGPEGGILEALESLAVQIPQDEAGGEDLAGPRAQLQEMLHLARGLSRQIVRHRRERDGDLDVLPQLQERLSHLEQLQRKHRKPLDEILSSAAQMRAALDSLAAGEAARATLVTELAEAQAALEQAARDLSRAREEAAAQFVGRVHRELRELGMPGVELAVRFGAITSGPNDRALQIGALGAERVVLEARTNPGASLRPLGEIASGGEMARVALAVRVVLGERGRALMTVFDEIDAGLGATAARSVARRLQRISRHRQVLLVTHLPVIAAAADHHIQVWKEQDRTRARSGLRVLDETARIGEIARMLGGSAQDRQAREHAAALMARER